MPNSRRWVTFKVSPTPVLFEEHPLEYKNEYGLFSKGMIELNSMVEINYCPLKIDAAYNAMRKYTS